MNPDAEKPPHYKWDQAFQREILGLMLTDRTFLLEARPLVKPDYFTDQAHKRAAQILYRHFDAYGVMPTRPQLFNQLADVLEGKKEDVRAYHFGELGNVLSGFVPGLAAREYYSDKLLNFAKAYALREAFKKSLAVMADQPDDEETWAEVDSILRSAMTVERHFDEGLSYFETFEDRYARKQTKIQNQEIFTSGFPSIDASLNNGGMSRGEMYSWVGLCFAKGTRVRMFDGTLKAVEDVACGDRLMGDDSTPRTVSVLSHGYGPLYRVTPTKGEPYVVNEYHVLSLKNCRGVPAAKEGDCPPFCKRPAGMGDTGVFNISVLDYFKQSSHFRVAMKGWRTGVEYPSQPVGTDPYAMGVRLGDENRHAPYEGKFVPPEYLVNDREARLQILAGILDADGHLGRGGFEFASKGRQLAEGVTTLARSLGFAAYMEPCVKRCRNDFEGDDWRVRISGDCSQIPTRLSCKKAGPREQAKDHLLTGIEVEPIGEGEYYGFSVDGNHLFLLEDFTVVHNSGSGKSLCLVRAALANLERRKRVLYITLEISQDDTAERFDAQLADPKRERGVTIKNLVAKREILFEALREYMSEDDDKRLLVIKQFPGGQMGVPEFRAYYAQMCLRGFRPDVVIIDYLGEMKDYPGVKTHESRYMITRDLRGFSVEEQFLMLTAMQPNRSAKEVIRTGSLIDDEHLADAYAQIRPLDGMWSLNQMTDEKGAGVGRVFVIKHRSGKSRFDFYVLYDWDTLGLSEISNDSYMKLFKTYQRDKKGTVTDTLRDEMETQRAMDVIEGKGFKDFTSDEGYGT